MARRQKEKSRQTMEELMAAAVDLFSRKGYAAATVAEITSHAGYAKGSFYRHWESKDELFLQIVENKLSEYRRARDTDIKRADSLEKVLRTIWDFLESMVADRNWAKVFLEFTVHAARDASLRQRMRRSQYRLSERIFARLIQPFVGPDYPAEKVGALNTALFEGFMVHNAMETGVLQLDDVREAAVTLALQAGTDGNNPFEPA